MAPGPIQPSESARRPPGPGLAPGRRLQRDGARAIVAHPRGSVGRLCRVCVCAPGGGQDEFWGQEGAGLPEEETPAPRE